MQNLFQEVLKKESDEVRSGFPSGKKTLMIFQKTGHVFWRYVLAQDALFDSFDLSIYRSIYLSVSLSFLILYIYLYIHLAS
jgi:hypothetical protein